MARADLVLRRVELCGRPGLDVAIANGRISEIGQGLAMGVEEIDAAGGALIPGLIDHHIHLLAAAARAESLVLDAVNGLADLARAVSGHASARPDGNWLRATGYHERMAGPLTRDLLDRLAPSHPIRVQDQTGALWVLNSRALDLIDGADSPPCLERDARGRPTGQIWRGDAWLRGRIGANPPPLAPLGAVLSALGITGVMDASAVTDASAADLIADAVRTDALPLRVGLMSAGPLHARRHQGIRVGPVKVLLDDSNLIDLDDFIERIQLARTWRRPVAVHCVTEAELALTLAAFHTAGSRPGDRIEHGGLIATSTIPELRALGLTVVTQPIFIRDRGERYLTEVEPGSRQDLYRCASLLAAGVRVAGSSDAPYGGPDPWAAMQTCTERLTHLGQAIGLEERISGRRALALYLGGLASPGGRPRRIRPGAIADLCLLKAPLSRVLAAPSRDAVAATLVGGRVHYRHQS